MATAKHWEVLGITQAEITKARLSDQQLLCAFLYLTNGLKKSQAYTDAGYKSKTPHVDGHKLLARPNIRKLIKLSIDNLIEPLKDELFWGVVDRARIIILCNVEDYAITAEGKITAIDGGPIDTRTVKSKRRVVNKHTDHWEIEFHDPGRWTEILKTYVDIARGYDAKVLVKAGTMAEKTDEELEDIEREG